MFGRSFLKDFDEDPFFSGFNSQRDIFDSFGGFRDPFMAIDDGKNEKRIRNGRRNRENSDGRVADPFGGFFQSMNNMMSEMQKQMSHLETRVDSNDPNAHSFSSSTVMSYRNDGKSEPKYYQASTSTRRAPGQIREIRRSVRDSEQGIEKMAVGHHIGERGKVIERRRNLKARGGIEEEKNFLHIGEDEEKDFDREWRDKTKKFNIGDSKKMAGIGVGGKKHTKEVHPHLAQTRAIKTPAVASRCPSTPPRPGGPSKSGRTRSKY